MKKINRSGFARAMIEAMNGHAVMNQRVLTYSPETGQFWSGSSLTPLGEGEIVVVDDVSLYEADEPKDFINGFEELWESVKYRVEHEGEDDDYERYE